MVNKLKNRVASTLSNLIKFLKKHKLNENIDNFTTGFKSHINYSQKLYV